MLYDIKKRVLQYWYSAPSFLTYLLWPLSVIYISISNLRKYYLLHKLPKKIDFEVPVIVVGNITVGGTGKTPFVIWLSKFLQEHGYRPGIVSRGYGGKSLNYPLAVTSLSNPQEVGDEAVLLASRAACPVAIDPDRVGAVKFLLKNHECNIIISDDGLQHYRLSRDIEIAIIDGERGFGNGFCLPAGPLREPITRLNTVDFIVINSNSNDSFDFSNFNITNKYTMKLIPGKIYNISSIELEVESEHFLGEPLHAVAGIGNPERFFEQLRSLGLTIWPHSFSDHHRFIEKEFSFISIEAKVIMTEKDAVKCAQFADYRYWCLPVSAECDPELGEAILAKINII
jgi:tetraacyldisaccharide 4'-kinase